MITNALNPRGFIYTRYKKELSQLFLALIHCICFVHVTASAILLYYLKEWQQFWCGFDLPDKFTQRWIFICK